MNHSYYGNLEYKKPADTLGEYMLEDRISYIMSEFKSMTFELKNHITTTSEKIIKAIKYGKDDPKEEIKEKIKTKVKKDCAKKKK